MECLYFPVVYHFKLNTFGCWYDIIRHWEMTQSTSPRKELSDELVFKSSD